MVIREEQTENFPEIYDFVQTAFATAKVADGKEQEFVNQLRAGEGYLPRLALCAWEGQELIGHIMLTKAHIENATGKFPTLLLAPLCVKLEYRKRGVGTALVKESFRRAVQEGYQSVVLVGDPAYYGRFGFRQASDFGIRYPEEIPAQYVLACEIFPEGLKGITGTIGY